MFKRLFYGPLNENISTEIRDIVSFDKFVLWLLVAAIFLLGLFPNILLSPMHATITNLTNISTISKLPN